MDLLALKTVFRFGLTVLGISALVSCAEVKSNVPYYHTPDFTPLWLGDVPDTLHKIDKFSFTDQSGNTISERTLEGKIYVVNFFFTKCPSICPKMMKNIRTVADSFKSEDKIMFVSFSVTPELDSVSQLNKYAHRFEIDSNRWHLLTGDKNKIYTLARKSFFAEGEIGFNADSTEFLHTEHVLLIDANKNIRGVYNGTLQLEMEKLREDIRILLED